MIKISDITIDYRSLLERKDTIYYTDQSKPVLGFCVESDEQKIRVEKACISLNGWQEEIDEIAYVIYGGEELLPMQTYTIRVQVKTTDGNHTEAHATFETGRMGLPWKGNWITDPSIINTSPLSPRPLEFRKKIILQKPVRSLKVMATAIGIYDLYWDGKRINTEYFAPGFTDYDHHLQYGIYPLENIQPGTYELRAIVAAGWAVGRSTYIQDTNKSRSLLMADRQAFLSDVFVEYMDGTSECVGTDASFEVAQSGTYLFADFYDGEIYEADPSRAVYAWKKAEDTQLKEKPTIQVRYGEPVLGHEIFAGKYIGQTRDGEFLYDFGQNLAGVIRMTVQAKAGDVITIRHAEVLDGDDLYVQNLRSAKQIIEYHCEDGEQTYSPRFTYMGFRYIAVKGIRPEQMQIEVQAVYSDLLGDGGFSCSNEDLNQLQNNIVWSGKSNLVDIPTDCPQRDERQGWTGDIALFASTACFNFAMDHFLMKWLKDMKAEQGKTGSIPFVVPVRKGITPSMTTSCWGDACIIVPYELYRYSGNVRILEEMYPVMKKYMKDVRRWANMGLLANKTPYVFSLPFQFGDWCAPYGSLPDWLAKGKWTGTAYYAHACDYMEKIARILGKDRDADEYRRLGEKVADTYIDKFMQGKGKMPDTEAFQTGYVLPLYFSLAKAEKVNQTMVEELWKCIQADGGHLKTGFTATPYLLFALADHGYVKEAYKLLLEDTNPSWLYQIRKGATTTWEQWDIITESGEIKEGSMNHYAYGAVGDFLYRRVCGLEAEEAGYRRFRVQPLVGGDLTFAECWHRCPYGIIRVRWEKREDDLYDLQVQVPVGTSCRVVLANKEIEMVENGNYEFTWKE